MGRTQRSRKRRQAVKECLKLRQIINLQKALSLKCPKIQINFFNDTGWGVKCKKKIHKGEALIALPLRHLITPAVQSDIFSALSLKNEAPQFVLSIFLVYESHLDKKSNYFVYIDSLPKSFTNLYFCENDEINLLPDFIKEEVISQRIILESIILKLQDVINGKICSHCGKTLENIFSQEKFIWAWFIVNTRSVYYEDENLEESLALAPFLDFFNHSDEAVTEVDIDLENKLYILKTSKSYSKFEQVFIKYGAHSNLMLFLEYGFILPENSNDFIEFTFEEVVESVKKFDSSFGEISKLKYNFIISNKLNHNLTKSKEFSWNFSSLVLVMISKTQNLSLLQAKIYSNAFTFEESSTIQKIGKIASEIKTDKFKQCLAKMERIENCTESFQIAKHLVKIYINLMK